MSYEPTFPWDDQREHEKLVNLGYNKEYAYDLVDILKDRYKNEIEKYNDKGEKS